MYIKFSRIFFFLWFFKFFFKAAYSQSHNGGSFLQDRREKGDEDVVMMEMKWRMRDDR